jgi:hypothetical protein
VIDDASHVPMSFPFGLKPSEAALVRVWESVAAAWGPTMARITRANQINQSTSSTITNESRLEEFAKRLTRCVSVYDVERGTPDIGKFELPAREPMHSRPMHMNSLNSKSFPERRIFPSFESLWDQKKPHHANELRDNLQYCLGEWPLPPSQVHLHLYNGPCMQSITALSTRSLHAHTHVQVLLGACCSQT